jgi:predicted kinase
LRSVAELGPLGLGVQQMAQMHSMNKQCRSSNRLIIVCGLSFAGKSTLANTISAEFGYPQVDVDETKLDLFGSAIDDADLSSDEWRRIYRGTDDKIRAHLRNGDSVVDASRNFRRSERTHARSLAARMRAALVVVYIDAPESLVRQRWAQNRHKQIRRNVSDDLFEEIIAGMEAPTADEKALVFKHDDNIENWLAEHAGCLAGKT